MSEEGLAKYESSLGDIDNNDLRVKIQNFQTLLHKEPKAEEIQTNKQANNSRYIPISHLEMKLDEMFFGIWSTKNFQSKTVVNEEVGSIELWYFHPTAKTWLCRIGAGAVMIMQRKDSDITDVGAKIKNTMTKDFPHLKAECFRNACLSLGKSFGRDLNREFEDQYNPIIKENIPEPDQTIVQELNILLSEFSSYDDLKSKAVNLKLDFVKKGLDEKLAYDIIKNKLSSLK
jgi:hypothetical protein